LIIFSGALSTLIRWIRAIVISWQSDLLNTKVSKPPVCDQFITRTKEKNRKRSKKIKLIGKDAMRYSRVVYGARPGVCPAPPSVETAAQSVAPASPPAGS